MAGTHAPERNISVSTRPHARECGHHPEEPSTTEMARIIQLVHRYPPARGGAESHAHSLASVLAGRGHEIVVHTTTGTSHDSFVNPHAPHLPKGMAMDGAVSVCRHPVWVFPGQRNLLRAINLLPIPVSIAPWLFPWGPVCPSLSSAETGKPPAVVHAMGFPHGSIIAAGGKIARRHGARLAITPFWHPGAAGKAGSSHRRGFDHPSLVALARRADILIVQSRSEKSHYAELGIEAEKIVMAPPGINPETVSGGDRRRGRSEWGLPDDAVVIGHLAPLCQGKGAVALVETLSAMAHLGVHGILAGPVLPDARKAVGLAGANIRILPPLDDRQRRDFFASIDIFCLPSVLDSFGLVLLEAWSNGVPCVAASVGGPGELVGRAGGLLVKEPSASHLRQALGILAADASLRQRLGEEGKAIVRREYLAHDRYQALAKILEGLAHAEPTAPTGSPGIF
ncbi:MAG: glycosyltransferase family 4 protein [Planctomycetes bacterium]|nr:glycosyltransferase family 4 protein [Planctomycetota bacterium]